MPEYLSPGVYVEEIELGAKPIEGVSTSTAGFLGLTERGPTEVQLVTGFAQFQRLYGGFVKEFYLPYAVDGFFRNGGQRCFIGRIVCTGAKAANLVQDKITFEAVGEGEWSNRVAIRIEKASVDNLDLFKLTAAYWSKNIPANLNVALASPPVDPKRALRQLLETATSPVEVFDNLSGDPDSPDYYKKKINGTSNYIKVISPDVTGRPANTEDTNPDVFVVPLKDGSDGAGITSGEICKKPDRDDFLGVPAALPGERRGLTAFADIDEISIINVPDLHLIDLAQRETLIDDVLSQCELLKDRFAIFEASIDDPSYKKIDKVGWERPSKYGAFYYPWIRIFDPVTQLPKSIPPGGHIAGIYARTDQERGVHKAPANEVIRGATDVDILVTKGDQDILNPKGVNAIRVFPGRGIRVWGARTTILDPLWKYINVRRLFLFLEESIDEGSQSFVFEPNNEKLWDRVKQTITQFLTRVWRDGALIGTTPEEAFFVKVDRTTMTQDDIDNGRLIVLIGVAPVKPAEFVIFRIAQTRGGAEVTEA
jgi:phage tail sheath protein FI